MNPLKPEGMSKTKKKERKEERMVNYDSTTSSKHVLGVANSRKCLCVQSQARELNMIQWGQTPSPESLIALDVERLLGLLHLKLD